LIVVGLPIYEYFNRRSEHEPLNWLDQEQDDTQDGS
jgi:hypothetical protein